MIYNIDKFKKFAALIEDGASSDMLRIAYTINRYQISQSSGPSSLTVWFTKF